MSIRKRFFEATYIGLYGGKRHWNGVDWSTVHVGFGCIANLLRYPVCDWISHFLHTQTAEHRVQQTSGLCL